MFRELRRTWSHGYAHYIPRFKEVFPELGKIDNEDLADRFRELDLDFYHEKVVPVKFWVRFTMPFALILMVLMLVGMPLCFLITGSWRYPLGDKNVILNWFRSLKLF